MPASVAAAVVSSVVAEAVVGSTLAGFVVGKIASQVIGAAAGFVVSSGLRSALGGGAEKAPTQSPAFTAQAQARTQVVRSAVTNRQIVYGQAMVSGPLVFAASTNDNDTLHLVIALAGHECEEIGAIYFNDEALGSLDGSGNVTTGRYANKVLVKKHLGATDQVADADLVAAGLGWTTSHRLQGVAYIYLRLTWDRDVFPRGIPNVKAVVKGKKLYDPRDASTAWSDNWALAVRDYLVSDYGLGCETTEIDDTAIAAAANVADESVSLAAGGTESRYTANGVIDMGQTPREAMDSLLTGGAGVLVWTAGQYILHAGAYASPTVTLDEDDLRGPISVRPRVARQQLYNAVKGTYVDPDKYWQPGDFAPVASSTYATQDGQVIYRDIALPVTTSSATAQRLAKIMLEKSRQAISVTFPAKLTAFELAVWDTVRVTIDALGWSAKEFKVIDWTFDPAGGVTLGLQEESSSCYTWSAEETTIDAAPDTNLPDPFNVAAPGVPSVAESLYETRAGAGVKARATITTVAPDDVTVERYQFEWKLASASSWQVLGITSDTSIEVADVAPGIYDARVKAINSIGVSSAYATRSGIELRGLLAPPAAVTGLSIQAAGGLAILTFDLHPDLDVRIGGKIRVRHASVTTGATWETSVSIGEAVVGNTTVAVLPLKAGTYLVKAEDSSGVLSTSAATISSKQATALAWSTLTTVQEDDDFLGTHTSTVATAGALMLGGSGTLDAETDFDSIAVFDFTGGIATSGTYDFASGMDLTTVKRVRLTSTITAAILAEFDQIDARAGNIDDWADFDGTAGASADAWVEVRETDDDPAGTPTWSNWKRLDAGEYQARGFDFRARLTSADPAYNIHLTQLRVTAEEIA